MFYAFNQNNSGGHLTINDKLCHRIYIEADSYEEASERAQNFGVYFNGCAKGIDCECCGDRWSDCEEKVNLPLEITLSVYTDLLGKAGDYKVEWNKKYGKYVRKEEPTILKEKYSSYEKYGAICIINSIEEYAQWLADDYGYGSPDSRIFYKDGIITEIKSQKEVA